MKKRIIFLTTLTLVFLSCFCSCSSGKDHKINIAAKDFTEQYILGEILKEMIEKNTDHEVELTSGVAGETSVILPAMAAGEFDISSDYDTTAWLTVLKKNRNNDINAMHRDLDAQYRQKYGLTWLGFYGFDNKYNLVVRKETAEAYHLKTFSDLAARSREITFGAGYEFYEREDGYEGLVKCYGFTFKETKEMNLSLKYTALHDGKVDVITVYKTDGRLADKSLVELEDDLHYFPQALCGTVIREEIVEKYPEIVLALEKLNDQISNDEMRAMNAAVDMKGRDAKKIAHEFLSKKGLIPND